MSLINDALNRARAEAASKEAVERGEIPAAEVPKAPPTRRQPAWVLASAGAAIVIVLFLLARRGPSATEAPAQRTARSPAAESARHEPQPAAAPQPETAEPELAQTRETVPDPAPAATSAALQIREPQVSGPQTMAPQTVEPQTIDAQAAESPTAEPQGAEPQGVEPQGVEPAALVPAADTGADTTRAAARGTERPSPASPEARPITIWPADGSNQETWYFVGKLELAGGGEIELGGIAWSELAPSAMLNGSLLTVGSEILGLRVVAIAPRTVTLAGRGQRFALQLAGTAN